MNYGQEIEECAAEIIAAYHDQPFAYVYEMDIHARMYCLLFNRLKSDSGFHPRTYLSYQFPNPANTVILQCHARIGSKHVDIGIWQLDETDLETLYTKKRVSHAIEIKIVWDTSFGGTHTKKVGTDLKKT